VRIAFSGAFIKTELPAVQPSRQMGTATNIYSLPSSNN